MSALYVDAVGMPVTLELEGPALRLRRPRGPDGRVPLRRLSRLVIRGPAHLDGRVIPALVQAGIPLAFLDARNRPIGTLLPAMLRRTDTRALLEEAETRGLLDEVREPWRAAEERRLVLELRTGLGLVMHDLRRRTVDRRILALLDARGAPLDGEDLMARMKALLDAHLAQLLLEEGLGWAWQGGDPEHWNLRADLADILILALVPDLLELADHLAARPERHDTPARLYRRFARRYERAAPRIARLTDALLARLRRRLREVLT